MAFPSIHRIDEAVLRACLRAFSTARRMPPDVRVAPETPSTSVDWLSMILRGSSSTGGPGLLQGLEHFAEELGFGKRLGKNGFGAQQRRGPQELLSEGIPGGGDHGDCGFYFGQPGEELDSADRWILTLFEDTVKDMNRYLGGYKLMEASSLIYEFFWHEFCDWYIELSKVKLYSDDSQDRSHAAWMLIRVLEGSLRLLHPIMPFITEEIWQRLPWQRLPGQKLPGQRPKSIMVAPYPDYNKKNVYRESVERMDVIKELVYNIRNIRGELNVPPELKAEVLIKTSSKIVSSVIETQMEVILSLAKLRSIEYGGDMKKPGESASAVGSGYEVYLPLRGLIDVEKEKGRLGKEHDRLEAEISRSSEKLKNKEFLTKAPEKIVQREQDRVDSHIKARDRVKGILDSLK